MRRIEAVTVSGDGPVYEAVLRLGDVTVLTGPNDSGKTRVLRFIEQGLMGPDYPDYLGVEVQVFGVAEASEIDDFLTDRDGPSTGIVGAESDAVAAFGSAVELPAHPDGVRVGVLSPGSGDLLPGWRYGRALIDLDERIRAAVEQQREICGLLDEKELEEPLCLEPLGGFDPRILPEAIMVPCDAADMELRVASAVTRLTRALRALAFAWRRVADIAGPLSGGPSPDWVTDGPVGHLSDVQPSWEWLLEEDEDTKVSRVHPAAVEACAVMDRMLSVLLPGFIVDDYWVRIVPGQPTAIARGRYVRIRLLRRESSDSQDGAVPEHDGRWFDLAEAANGFNVWIELALHEAVQRVRYCSCLLQQYVLALRLIDEEGFSRIRDITYTAEEVLDGEPPDWDTSERDQRVARRLDGLGVDELKAGLEDLLARLRDPRLPSAQPLDPSMLESSLEFDSIPEEHRGEALEAIPRGRVYLLDEPEQRLHPVLQRRAARWLGALMSEWGAQCVLATHSVAFMDLPGDTRNYEITRTEDAATVIPLDAASLTPYSQLAKEMGLDRGELLSLTRAFLVTTALTAILLDELCADRLAQAGVTVVAVDQDRQRTEMLASALLAQLSTIPLAALFTAITPDKIDELRDLSAPQRRQEIATTAEEEAVAALIDFSIQQEVEAEILTSNVPSILDLIDETAIRRLATGPQPFPGHATAHERHQNSPDTYERFVKDSYGLTINESTLRAAARDMRGAGLAPQPLTDALWRVEQLTINL